MSEVFSFFWGTKLAKLLHGLAWGHWGSLGVLLGVTLPSATEPVGQTVCQTQVYFELVLLGDWVCLKKPNLRRHGAKAPQFTNGESHTKRSQLYSDYSTVTLQ
jgi:hypothetical protein